MTSLYEVTDTVMYNETKTGLTKSEQGRTTEEIEAILNGNKYIDIYDYNIDVTDRSHGMLGDATIETGPFSSVVEANGHVEVNNAWYSDDATFIISSSPSFIRGRHCYNGGSYGITAFCALGGYPHSNVSFRVVII